MKTLTTALCLLVVMSSASAFACGVEGSATRDGYKVDGTVRVTNSWNSVDAYPRNGWYSMELGESACGESVEIYVNNHYSMGKLRLPKSGNARLDLFFKGLGDKPEGGR